MNKFLVTHERCEGTRKTCGTYRGVRDVFDAQARLRFEGPVSVSFAFFARREGKWRVGDVYRRMSPEGCGLFHSITLFVG